MRTSNNEEDSRIRVFLGFLEEKERGGRGRRRDGEALGEGNKRKGKGRKEGKRGVRVHEGKGEGVGFKEKGGCLWVVKRRRCW